MISFATALASIISIALFYSKYLCLTKVPLSNQRHQHKMNVQQQQQQKQQPLKWMNNNNHTIVNNNKNNQLFQQFDSQY